MSKKETKFNFEGVEEILDKPEQSEQYTDVLTDKQVEDVQKEIELEKKFGDQGLRTFAERGASAATFGLSDQALVAFGGEEMQEALRERAERNQAATIGGEVAGVVVPALLSGGTTALAKGASAGVKTAAKIGQVAEKLTAKQLASIAAKTGKNKAALEVIRKSLSKGAGSAVEGAFYGAGELVKEDALGTAEFNAENLAASAGIGALIGGAAGGVLGTAEGLIPVIKNNRIVDYVAKKVNTNIDKRVSAAKLAKMTPGEITKLKQNPWGQQIFDNMPKYFKENLDLKIGDSLETLAQKSSKEMTRLGEEIGETAARIDDLAQGTQFLPTKSKVALRVQNSLREVAEEFGKNPDAAASDSIKKINRRIKSWDKWLADDNPITAVELKELKTSLQKAAKWNKSIDQIPLQGKLDRSVAEAVRKEMIDLSERVSVVDENIAAKLKQLNLDYGTSLNVSDKLNRAVDKEAASELVKFKDILLADLALDLSGGVATAAVASKKFLESDFRRKLTLLTNLETANKKVGSKINSSVKNFFKKTKRAAVPASTKVLLNSNFALPGDDGSKQRQPKNKKEAFKKLSTDLQQIQQDPEKLLNHLSTNALATTDAAPLTATALNQTIINAVNFLVSKIPLDSSMGSGMFRREYEPSSIEIAKFERYVQAVENPMSVFDDLESGTLSREAVEALQVVYPDLYTRMQDRVMDEVVKNPDIDYNKKIQLGILLDVPSDSSLIPANITGLQQTFTDEEQAQNAAKKQETAVETTQGGLSNIDKANRVETQTQQVTERE